MKNAFFLPLLFWVFPFWGFACKQAPVPQAEPVPSNQVKQISVFQLPHVWKNQADQSMRLADLGGKSFVLAMVYTSCEFSCPRIIADMRNIEKQIPAAQRGYVQMVLVSIDPENDTPERLKAFAKEQKFDLNHWTLLTGTQDTVQEMAAVLGFKYKKTTPIDFAHSNLISVFDPAGKMVFQQEGIAADPHPILQSLEKVAL